ncbi:MAG: polyketide synthase, partial [Holophagales bacterium]|nr:polyketide synthase [Holophagales bacterium]
MRDSAHRAVAVVGLGAILPDAPDVSTYWNNLCAGRYSIGDVPEQRWDTALYYDADPKAPDKTYSRIGGFVRDYEWQPLQWRLPIPPKVAAAMDRTQKWSIAASRQAIADFGQELPKERTAVIFGNAMAGDQHYLTAVRIFFPEYAAALEQSGEFQALPEQVRGAIVEEMRASVGDRLPVITEDTMPGELANIIAGRVAAVFDLHGPNFIVDAACASAMGAITAAIEGLEEEDYDLVITGGIDANMSASSYVKFSKIGALSATGTRPYAAGADGFVMGEGAAVFILKRLADAERDGDRIYAVLRSTGGSSDGKGKGITAPNPVGQKLAVERAWTSAGLHPSAATLIEGHGTSTRVGDRVELQCLSEVFGALAPDLPTGSIALGSVKSNIGHLKGAAGAAGLLKAVLSLHHRQIPPSLNFGPPNEAFDFEKSPFFVNTELRPWENGNGHGKGQVRSAGVSAFGFGGTNFHAVLEEHVPGRLTADEGPRVAVAEAPVSRAMSSAASTAPPRLPASPRGALVLGASTAQ